MIASLYDWLVLPATTLHSVLALWVPPVAGFFDEALDYGDWRIPVALSVAIWILVGFAVGRAARFAFHHCLAALRELRSWLFRYQLPVRMHTDKWRTSLRQHLSAAGEDGESPEVRLDGEMLAIMEYAAALDASRTLAAPEIAEAFDATPRRIEKELKQLCALQLLERATSSTDGYREYRLSRPGAMYVDMLR